MHMQGILKFQVESKCHLLLTYFPGSNCKGVPGAEICQEGYAQIDGLLFGNKGLGTDPQRMIRNYCSILLTNIN